MSHALAEVVHAELFGIFAGTDGFPHVECPSGDWSSYNERAELHTITDALAAARAHIAEAHTAPETRVETHNIARAVDQLATDAYPALIPAPVLDADDTRPVRTCQASGNTVRGPLVPVEIDGVRKHYCLQCFDRHRRSVAHVDDPLPVWPQDRATDVTWETS